MFGIRYNRLQRGPAATLRGAEKSSEAAVPKASRGRRPAPNPKRRTPRPGRPIPVGAAASGVLTAEEGAVERPLPVASPVRRAAPMPMASAGRRATPVAQVRRGFAESAADYRYVQGDLKRIAILAGGLVVLLIVLSFLQPLFS